MCLNTSGLVSECLGLTLPKNPDSLQQCPLCVVGRLKDNIVKWLVESKWKRMSTCQFINNDKLIKAKYKMEQSETIELTNMSDELITIQTNRIVAVSKLENHLGSGCRIYLLASEQPIAMKETYEEVTCMVWG